MSDPQSEPQSEPASRSAPAAIPLRDRALAVRSRAYVPYSGFHVGAALRAADGTVHLGCNVENAAYPEGTCAEAGAIAAMIAAGSSRIAEVYVVADCPRPVPPCGGCRQKLAEFGAADTPVILGTVAGQETRTTIGDLLPGAFTADDLGGHDT